MFPSTFWACQPIPRPHCDYLWGNRLWECVWEYRVPQCGHLVEVTFHCKRAHGKESRATRLVHKFQRWSKASTVRCEKTAIGCISKQLLGCIAFRPTERKMQILPSRFNIQVDTRCIPTFSKKFPHRPRLIRFLLQRWKQWWNRHLDVGLPSPVSVGTFHMVSGSGEISRQKWPPSKHFPECVSLSTQYAGKAVFLQGS